MVLSRSRLIEQHHLAEQKLEAVRAADQIIARWWSEESKSVPLNADGALQDHPRWVWQTEVINARPLEDYDAQIVRLRILDTSNVGAPVELTAIDLVLPRQTEAGLP